MWDTMQHVWATVQHAACNMQQATRSMQHALLATTPVRAKQHDAQRRGFAQRRLGVALDRVEQVVVERRPQVPDYCEYPWCEYPWCEYPWCEYPWCEYPLPTAGS